MTSSTPCDQPVRSLISTTLATPALRADRWLLVLDLARKWSTTNAADIKKSLSSSLEKLDEVERFFAYPGAQLLERLKSCLSDDDNKAFLRLAQRISTTIVSRKYHRDASAWNMDDHDDEPLNRLPQAITHLKSTPYFEVLSVVPHARSRWPLIQEEARGVRRAEDDFIYQPVIVGNAQDALTGILLNPDIGAVVLYEGFTAQSLTENPLLAAFQSVIDFSTIGDDETLVLQLAQAIKKIRPEMDIYLLSDRNIETLAGKPESRFFNRIFYQMEEPLELHLSILEGIRNRYKTPFFDNLKRYAQRPIATFHALPIARGKSVFTSNWISDMGEFYGPNLFLAESSATTGGLDSLLEPTGNIKDAQAMAAQAFGADHAFFVTNGTSTSNKMVLQALLAPGDIVILDRNCHKSHHYGCVLAGAQPYYVEAFPLVEYSMYGGVPLRTIKQALLALKAHGDLARVKMVDLTNCTFDGHVYDTRRVMEECLAIKPDLIFLWDEAWFGFAHWSPLLRQRTAMGAAAALTESLTRPEAQQAWDKQASTLGNAPDDETLLNTRLVPDPRAVRLRVYQTNSVHKSMSALRQGSIVLVKDVDFEHVESQFHEAVFTHASTSPNLQIIASLDIARRQMQLEGYGLVSNALQIALEIRKQVNSHKLISKYFRVLNSAEMIPGAFRQSGLTDYNDPSISWDKALQSIKTDEFLLDPTRMTLSCGAAGFDGTTFKNTLADKFNIQLNKTSRNSVLLQSNINNTRSDIALLIRVLVDIATDIDKKIADNDEGYQKTFENRVHALVDDLPELPNFSHFDDRYRDQPKDPTLHGDIRRAFYDAYNEAECEYIPLDSPEIAKRLQSGPALVSANFVIPYPPGFPIMVPGQVITQGIVDFMRKLDVKEIHGFNKALGLKLLKRVPGKNKG
ncbi:MAG: beta-eliminating lyase-related protein [Acetobacter fabarum]|jgi:arginine decarboxylase|uniref:beta-eliminating lyase-related protein n=1 Tax=Acetobacter fabarum TaxID=483199 RepID=UPI00243216C5|nr:beta-eliminating lyase-related protein [Acetobacter fabarum]MCH4025271.1 beta-eliminating lyase-related protein [Acetobacter fabarum]MCH4056335.1 beta-eliminating lyase-related protein [Acetobacter fabarum]MCH4128779.1 beta-eliminating lyase-related protein [Acetobacter fabarum]MCH4141980.1 beta-eliminating lyase-related protein [Acetobacter fabarum]MCI1298248.1 beta-eliminating lyase-related protein [Acetobacter fabarum]